jgi:hypothetical protein
MSPGRLTDCGVHAQPPVRAQTAVQRHLHVLCTAFTAPMTTKSPFMIIIDPRSAIT